MIDPGHMASGMGILDPHQEIQFVDALAGTGTAIFDEGYLEAHSQVHDHIADHTAASAGCDGA